MDLVEAARSYKNVRFRHRGRNRRGVDCVGLAWAAYKDCGREMPDFLLYAKEPSAHGPGLSHYMERALGKPVHLPPVKMGDLNVGDVIVLRFEIEPHHVGIVTDYLYGGFGIIHACGHNRRVIETRLSDDMVNRITHVYRRPV